MASVKQEPGTSNYADSYTSDKTSNYTGTTSNYRGYASSTANTSNYTGTTSSYGPNSELKSLALNILNEKYDEILVNKEIDSMTETCKGILREYGVKNFKLYNYRKIINNGTIYNVFTYEDEKINIPIAFNLTNNEIYEVELSNRMLLYKLVMTEKGFEREVILEEEIDREETIGLLRRLVNITYRINVIPDEMLDDVIEGGITGHIPLGTYNVKVENYQPIQLLNDIYLSNNEDDVKRKARGIRRCLKQIAAVEILIALRDGKYALMNKFATKIRESDPMMDITNDVLENSVYTAKSKIKEMFIVQGKYLEDSIKVLESLMRGESVKTIAFRYKRMTVTVADMLMEYVRSGRIIPTSNNKIDLLTNLLFLYIEGKKNRKLYSSIEISKQHLLKYREYHDVGSTFEEPVFRRRIPVPIKVEKDETPQIQIKQEPMDTTHNFGQPLKEFTRDDVNGLIEMAKKSGLNDEEYKRIIAIQKESLDHATQEFLLQKAQLAHAKQVLDEEEQKQLEKYKRLEKEYHELQQVESSITKFATQLAQGNVRNVVAMAGGLLFSKVNLKKGEIYIGPDVNGGYVNTGTGGIFTNVFLKQGDRYIGPDIIDGQIYTGPNAGDGMVYSNVTLKTGQIYTGPNIINGQIWTGTGDVYIGVTVIRGNMYTGPDIINGSIFTGPTLINGEVYRGPILHNRVPYEGPPIVQEYPSHTPIPEYRGGTQLTMIKPEKNKFKKVRFSDEIQRKLPAYSTLNLKTIYPLPLTM